MLLVGRPLLTEDTAHTKHLKVPEHMLEAISLGRDEEGEELHLPVIVWTEASGLEPGTTTRSAPLVVDP